MWFGIFCNNYKKKHESQWVIISLNWFSTGKNIFNVQNNLLYYLMQ